MTHYILMALGMLGILGLAAVLAVDTRVNGRANWLSIAFGMAALAAACVAWAASFGLM
jgi:hypothetical protein